MTSQLWIVYSYDMKQEYKTTELAITTNLNFHYNFTTSSSRLFCAVYCELSTASYIQLSSSATERIRK